MRWFRILIGIVAFAGLGIQSVAAAPRPVVFELRLENEAITPMTAQFIERAIKQAEQEDASCLIIVLDTPGGLVDSTRKVVKSILNSRVPVVVYVAPQGARAASAGVFITLSAHVAAMAPGTNIGAAHPVQIGGLPGSPRTPDKEDGKKETGKTPLEDKIVNDTVAWARALAELRGRNADWAERTVKESHSVSASTAVHDGAVDFLAEDFDDLLARLDGREVKLPQGMVVMHTRQAEVRPLEMWWGERVLSVLTNPNVAFFLLIIGFYGILFELYTPGWGVSGTLGIVCMLLGLFALAVLPINYVGLALIAVALALFTAEVFVVSYGALTMAGIACLVLGGLMLVDSPVGFQRVSLGVLLPVALATAGITFFLVGSIVRTHRGRVCTGSEAMSGLETVVRETFVPAASGYTGMVHVHGELWQALSITPVQAGQRIIVDDRDGLTLRVHALDGQPTDASSKTSSTSPK